MTKTTSGSWIFELMRSLVGSTETGIFKFDIDDGLRARVCGDAWDGRFELTAANTRALLHTLIRRMNCVTRASKMESIVASNSMEGRHSTQNAHRCSW